MIGSESSNWLGHVSLLDFRQLYLENFFYQLKDMHEMDRKILRQARLRSKK